MVDRLPNLKLKMESQDLNCYIASQYLPEKREVPRTGKLLYDDEELLNVLKLIVFNLGVKMSLDSIPHELIKQYMVDKECQAKTAETKSHDTYVQRFLDLIIKQRDYGLTEQESFELKEKCGKTIEKIDWYLK